MWGGAREVCCSVWERILDDMHKLHLLFFQRDAKEGDLQDIRGKDCT